MLQAVLRRQRPAAQPGLIGALQSAWRPQQADQAASQCSYSTRSSSVGGGGDAAPSSGSGGRSRGAATSAAAYAALLPSLRLGSSASSLQLRLVAQLQELVEQARMSVEEAADLCSAAAALSPTRQLGFVAHSSAVAAWLQEQGLQAAQLASLLRRCPYLFSWPLDRAVQRFTELAGLGLAPAEAALCFERCPGAAWSSGFEDTAAVLAALFHAGKRASDGSRSGHLLLGDLLRKQPTAVGLLMISAGTVQQRLRSMRRQFSRHWAPKAPEAVIVTALRKQHGWSLLKLSARHCAALEQLLQQQLGRRPGDGTRLLAAVLEHKTQAARCSLPVMGERVQQLRQAFGQDALLAAPRSVAAQLLATTTSQWQQSLAVWGLLGVADPLAVAAQQLGAVTYGWLEPVRLMRLLALQRLLPWQPTADEVLRRFATYVGGVAAPKLICRLLFIQRAGKLPLLVADKRGEQLLWRRQLGLQANRRAAGEPAYISMGDVAVLTDPQFCALLADPGCEADTAAGYAALLQTIEQQPEWQQLTAEAAALQQQLAARLDPSDKGTD